MAQCDVQALLTDAKCLYALNPQMLAVVQAQLWCNIAGSISPPPEPFFVLQSDDGLWYEISSFELAPGNAQIDFGQTPVAAGTQPYRVIINLTDGLKYRFRLYTDGGIVTGGYDDAGPTVELETPTVIIDVSTREYKLNFVTDGGVITPQLDQV